MSIPDSDTTHIRFVVNHDAPLKRGRLLFPDPRFRRYEMRPGWERRKQLAGFAGHVHRDRPIRFSKGTVVEQKGAIYEMNCLLKVVERPGGTGRRSCDRERCAHQRIPSGRLATGMFPRGSIR